MLGIVILNYNTWETTVECVSSITATATSKLPYSVYIIDNKSSNDSYAQMSKIYGKKENIKVIQSEINGGFAKGNNIGINAATEDGCDYIVVVNNDVLFLEDSLKNMVSIMKSNPNAVIGGPKIFTPNGNIQKSETNSQVSMLEYVGFRKPFLSNSKSRNVDMLSKDNAVEKVYSVSGCCIIIQASKFKEMGAFDENTFLYNEENIYSFQADSNKFDVLYIPSAVVIHNHGTTTGKMNLFVCTEFIKSGMYYWKEYREKGIGTQILIWSTYTSKYLIKSIYLKEMRKGWKNYLKETLQSMLIISQSK